MQQKPSVGILGIGVYLPEHVRRNDWWPEATVARWKQKTATNVFHWEQMLEESPTPGMQHVLDAMRALANDPFQGSIERRIVGEDEKSWDMETNAARDALARSGVATSDVDAVLGFSMCPDDFFVPSACVVHRNLGLNERCISTNVLGACNSFMMQAIMAQQLIVAGRARYVLCVQSSAVTRLLPQDDLNSPWVGDGASAVVFGPVSEGKGILGAGFLTDGNYYKSMNTHTKHGGPWWTGPSFLSPGDSKVARMMLLNMPEWTRQTIHDALHEAGHKPDEVDYYASHQGTVWLSKVTQEYAGMSNARSFSIFPLLASLSTSNVPTVLAFGEREGMLRDGDLVVMQAGGGGVTNVSLVMRWGR